MPTNTITLDEINLLKHSEEIKDINQYRTLYEIICTNGFKNYIRNIRSQNQRAGDQFSCSFVIYIISDEKRVVTKPLIKVKLFTIQFLMDD